MPGSAVSDLAGRVLAGRYLLHGAIGTGASGRVYAAEDTRLRRRVAVKVLHAALAEDAAFLRRFRAEAQLAASLHHPHIVTVHDWGEDDVPFMVLELLTGGSLRAMLDEGTRLTVPQAARVGRDVASALEYAHARGVLHRDVKPANLLFDEHGIVRVADFGLARALAEASWTEPAGAVFGTARYASPEQAQGVQLDGRSDVYSLALVLVEAVTGTVPFSADTTLGTLAARTQRSLEAPKDLGVLAPVIDRAGALEPEDRYPDAATMRAALADTAATLPPPAPLTLAGMSDRIDPHPTRAVGTKSAPLFDQDAADITVEPEPPRSQPPRVDRTAPVEPVVVPDADARPMAQRRLVPFVVALVALIIIGFATAALARVTGATPLAVPTFVGLDRAHALDAAQKAGFRIAWATPHASPDPDGVVIDQHPKAGSFSSGRQVTLTASSGPAKVPVPAIVGKSWADAKTLLDAAGVVYDANPQSKYSDTVPQGVVISVSPDQNVLVAPDTSVTVLLSAGHAPVQIPDVSKMSYDDAAKALQNLHFQVKAADQPEFSDTIPKDQVTRTDPAANTNAPYGSTITIYISKGPDLVDVPDVTGLTLDQATSVLQAKGLVPGTITGYKNANSTVISQSPSGGKAKRGSGVDLDFTKKSNNSLICLITGNC